MDMDQGEIVVYKNEQDAELEIEVKIANNTVWLTQVQMAELFDATKQNISLHIHNVFKDKELDPISTVKEYLTVRQEGLRLVKRMVKYYNLDVIISVGYRIKSFRGTQFRIWANNIIKDYLLKGHALNQRLNHVERKLIDHEKKFELFIKATLPVNEGIFYEGQIFDAWLFASNLIKSARKSIILIDNYIDESRLGLLAKRAPCIEAIIYTKSIDSKLKLDLQSYNKQYPPIKVRVFRCSHDRFLIIDNETIYHIGASLKDLGKKWFAFSRINLNVKEILAKIDK